MENSLVSSHAGHSLDGFNPIEVGRPWMRLWPEEPASAPDGAPLRSAQGEDLFHGQPT
jgi:hypothetical protein